jgi:hypothetical protein
MTVAEKPPVEVVRRSDIPSPDEARYLFHRGVSYVYRMCDIFESDFSVWRQNVGFTGGSISIDSSRSERRIGSVVLDNSDDIFLDSEEGLWYDKIIRLWRGVVVDDIAHVWLLGTFLIDAIDEASSTKEISLTFRDFTKKMLRSRLPAATSWPSGTDISTLLKALALNSGITQTTTPPSGKLTGREFSFERGDSRWEIADSISKSYGMEIFFDPWGRFVLREKTDPFSSPVALTLSSVQGEQPNVDSFKLKSSDERLYNHVVVTGESNEHYVMAQAENTLSSSPTRIDRIGRRTYTYTSQFITTQQQAQDVADKFLAIHALEQFSGSFTSQVYPWLDVGESLLFSSDNTARHPDRFLIRSLSIPLGLGTMNVEGARVTLVGS